MVGVSPPSDTLNFLEGKLLIALPAMSDLRFEKSVIYICAHSPDGAMGLILNKPIEGLGIQEMMQKLDIDVTARTPNLPILYGGPVETARGLVLHSNDYRGDQSTLAVSGDVFLTATLDILRAIAHGSGPKRAIFALGYAGWGAGQLENEIRLNSWLHCDADTKIVFDTNIECIWTSALLKLGIDVSALSSSVGSA